MNENGIPFQAALASFGAYFLVGLLFLFLMGSYESMMATHEMDHNYAVELRRRAGTRSMSEGDLTSFFAYDARSSCHIVPPRRPLRTTTGSATTRGRSLQNSRSHSSFAGLYDRDRARLSYDDWDLHGRNEMNKWRHHQSIPDRKFNNVWFSLEHQDTSLKCMKCLLPSSKTLSECYILN